MRPAIERFLLAASRRQDLVIVFFILLVTALMILPLPTWLMDVMIAINITIGMLFLMLAVYLKSPLEFSTLPSAILLSTLVRIAITISTTRLILVQADAGSIIQSFGEFVVSGNVIVGLVIFAIIAIAQFIVVTKGAERVAEVAARFVLDGLPGKQMSIDSDVRSGDIDRNEARRRRANLERESQYYGAMDGAMKFVKGDAIVSMIVILVNLIGGLVVGTVVQGMDAATAFQTYALLTVGDGLASQIPALLVAVSGGIVVTRVTTETSQNLGADLAKELISSSQSLAVVSAALVGLALVPGFPTLTFLSIAAIIGGGAFAIMMTDRRRRAQAAAQPQAGRDAASLTQPQAARAATGDPAPDAAVSLIQPAKPGDTFSINASPELMDRIDTGQLQQSLQTVVTEASRQRGIKVDMPGVTVEPSFPAETFEFLVDGAPTWRGRIPANKVFAVSEADLSDVAGLDNTERTELPGIGAGLWVNAANAASLGAKGISVVEPEAAMGAIVRQHISRWSSRAFGLQDADAWLNDQSQKGASALVQLVRQAVPLVRVADTMRHLLADGVSISQSKLVLEGLIELAPKVEDNQLLADHLRLCLSRPISANYADESRTIPAYVVELDLEDILRQSTREGPAGLRLNLDYGSAERLTSELKRCFTQAIPSKQQTVLMTSFDVRRPLRQFAISKGMDIPVLAFEEIASDYHVLPVGSFTESTLSSEARADDAA